MAESSAVLLNVNYNDLKKFSADFKAVYNAPNESAALSELETIKEKWGEEISLCDQQLGKQLGRCQFFLSVFRRYPQNYVYNKYHRRTEPSIQESYKNKECVSK